MESRSSHLDRWEKKAEKSFTANAGSASVRRLVRNNRELFLHQTTSNTEDISRMFIRAISRLK